MTTTLDINSFDPRSQDALILSLFEGLRAGEFFEVLTTTGNEQLGGRLNSLNIPDLRWQFLEKSSRHWRLKVEKLGPAESAQKKSGGCCGMCGG